MKTLILAGAASLACLAMSAPANAIGCLSGAAVGGAAGHFAGRHTMLGAAAGCAVGHHEAVMNQRRDAQAAQQQNDRYSEPYGRGGRDTYYNR